MLVWDNCRTYYNWNTEIIGNDSQIIDLTEVVANKMAIKVVGRGYHFSTENEAIKKAIKILENNNDLYSILYETTKYKSCFGYCPIVVNQNILGSPIIMIGQPYGSSQFGLFNANEEAAVVFVKIGVNQLNVANWLKVFADKYTIQNLNYTATSNDTIFGNNYTISPENIYKPYIVHNLGRCPAFLHQNKPKKCLWGGQIGYYYPDLTPGNKLQQMYNKIADALRKELDKNQTRVFMHMAPIEMQQLIQQLENTFASNDTNPLNQHKFFANYAAQLLASDLFINSKGSQTQGQDNMPVIMQGNPVIEKYIEGLEYIKDQAWEAAGLSPKEDSVSVKTEAEIYFHKSDEVETILAKKVFYEKQFKEIFDCCLLMLGIPEEQLEEYTFEFKPNLFIDKGQEIANQIQAISAGFSSPVRAYMAINGVTREEAKQALEDIQEELKEFPHPMEQALLNQNEPNTKKEPLEEE